MKKLTRPGPIVNPSRISTETVLGRALRLPLKLMPREAQLPILQGPLRGRKWVVGSGNHGCWIGSYEADKQSLFAHTIRPGQVVVDIGAHVGFYTLLAASLVGPLGAVYAFEPLPRNLAYLRKHVQANRLSNVQVIEAAVGDKVAHAEFAEGPTDTTGRVSADGSLSVSLTSLDHLYSTGAIRIPDILKIDVEGGELHVLRGALSLLREVRPTIFLATHGVTLDRECRTVLSQCGYNIDVLKGASADPHGLGELVATVL